MAATNTSSNENQKKKETVSEPIDPMMCPLAPMWQVYELSLQSLLESDRFDELPEH